MKVTKVLLVSLTVLVATAFTTPSFAGKRNHFFAFLDGFQEVPSVLTKGAGFFSAKLNRDGSIDFRLHLNKLSAPAGAAHLHFGQKGVNGNVAVTLCGGPPPAVVPACSNDVKGTITAEFVGGLASGQGIEAGDLEGVIRAMRSGNTYINVHNGNFPAGEVRGQVR